MAEESSDRSGFAIVVGGGGAVAAASCCGALRALADVGIDVADAQVVIGTSAGAAIAAELQLGRTVDEIIKALRSEESSGLGESMSRAWTSTPDLLRRAVGSSWIMACAMFPGDRRLLAPLPIVQKAFPGSLMSIAPEVWAERYSTEWPQRELWLVATDLDTGERVVLKGPNHRGHDVTLAKAVRSSCAVPGVYAPVRVGSQRLVDGGVRSPTNLDVAIETGCRSVIALAPMCFDRLDPPGRARAVGRWQSNSRLSREVSKVRRAGMNVLTICPGAEELSHHRFNIMSQEGNELIMAAAYEQTARRLADGEGRSVLDEIRADAVA
jgi:NTE family protein